MTGPAPEAPASAPALSPEQRWQALGEAYSRDILPPEQKAAYEEARSRGLVPGSESTIKHVAALAGETAAKVGANVLGMAGDTANLIGNVGLPWLSQGLASPGVVKPTNLAPDIATSEGIKSRMKDYGVIGNEIAKPRNEPEKVIAATGEGAGTGSIGGLPGAAYGAVSGALGELGRYAFEGTPYEGTAQTVGNLLPAGVQALRGVVRAGSNVVQKFNKWAPDYKAAVGSLRGSMSDEGAATANINKYVADQQAGLGAVPGHELTTFQASGGDAGLGAMERRASPLMAGALNERKIANTQATQAAIQGALPDQAATAAAVPAAQARVQGAVGAMGPGTTTAEDAGAAVRGDLQARMDAAKTARKDATAAGYQSADQATVPRQSLQQLSAEIKAARAKAPAGGPVDTHLGFMQRAIDQTYVPDRPVQTGMLDASGKPITRIQPGKDATGEPLSELTKLMHDKTRYPVTNPDAIDRTTALKVNPYVRKLRDILGAAEPEYAQANLTFGKLSEPVNKMEADHAGAILAKQGGPFGPQDYKLSNSAVTGKFLSGRDAPQATEQLMRAYDGNRPAALDAVGDHLVHLMKEKGAITPDNTVDLKAMAQFQQQNRPALDNFQSLSGKTNSAMVFQKMADRAQAKAGLLEKFQNGPNSEITTAEPVPGSRDFVISPTAFGKFVDKNATEITSLFGQPHLDRLQAIADEIKKTNLSNYTKTPGGGSDTVQKSGTVLEALLKGQIAKTGETIGTAIGAGVGALAGGTLGAGAGAMVGKVGSGKLAAMAQERNALTAKLTQDMMMNPAVAKLMLERYNPMNAPIQRNRIAGLIPYAIAVSHTTQHNVSK